MSPVLSGLLFISNGLIGLVIARKHEIANLELLFPCFFAAFTKPKNSRRRQFSNPEQFSIAGHTGKEYDNMRLG
jgi:hypothetical protein